MTASDAGAPSTTEARHASDLSPGTCPPIFQLADFDDVTTPDGAQRAFKKACDAARACQPNPGGVIQISPQTTPNFTVRTSVPSITVIDDRNAVRLTQSAEEGNASADVLSGSAGYPRATTLLRRTRTDPEATYPRGNDAAQAILQRTIHGASSIGTTLLFPVPANTPQAKWYPRGITGFFVGQRFVATARGDTNYTVTGLGWDPNPPPLSGPFNELPKGPLPYFVADTSDTAIPAGDLIVNKSFFNGLTLVSESHCGNQSAGALSVQHFVYGQGDTFGVSERTSYMGDVISAVGDEGGVGFAAEVVHDLANFRGIVTSFTVESPKGSPPGESSGTLIYDKGSNTERLGTCRPIINLNQNKWISTAKGDGQILIWGPNQRKAKTDSQAYGVVEGVGTHWTNQVVGRYLAVEEASEYFEPGDGFVYQESPPQARVRRWFRILSLSADSQGVQLLYVAIYPGGSGIPVPGSPHLIDGNKFAEKGGPPVNYIIAPGAIVSDVSLGVHENDNFTRVQGELILQPNGDFSTSTTPPSDFPFAPSDSIEQAIGPAPWNPTGFRVRHVTNIPTLQGFGEFSYLSENLGTAPVQAAFGVGSQPLLSAETHRNGYAYESAISVDSVVQYGLNIKAEMAYLKAIPGSGPYFMGVRHPGPELFAPDAGLGVFFAQGTGNRKVIAWSAKGGKGGDTSFATLGYDPETNGYYARGGVTFNIGAASLTQTRGISATDTKSVNLRGINVPVPASARQQPDPFMDVTFIDNTTFPTSPTPSPEEDELYGLQITPSWKTQYWVAKASKTKTGFRINFDQPAPANASIDWFLVR